MSSEMSRSDQQGEPIIRLLNLGKRYKIYEKPRDRIKQILWSNRRQYYQEFWALRNLTLDIYPGEQLAVIGRNGSGKSTLLQMICGTLSPSEGTVQCNGRIAALLELGSGFNPEFTGVENIYLNAALLGLSRESVDAKLEDILAFADIGDFVYQPVKSFSSGMQVRLAFAVIAHVDADILVCDEALSVGDAVFTQRCMRFIRNFRDSGTLLFVSHDKASVSSLTQTCLWIHQGSVQFYGPTKQGLYQYDTFCQQASGIMQEPAVASAVEELDHLSPWSASPDAHTDGAATITNVQLIDSDSRPCHDLISGSPIRLVVTALLHTKLDHPFIGYQVLNSRGLVIFGDNTIVGGQSQQYSAACGDQLMATFVIDWPALAAGDYSITVALSSGSQASHCNHHWINSAIHFQQQHTSNVKAGIFSPCNLGISLDVLPQETGQA
ncbi:ABC transporter ATP-binding protein [Synechococcus sp. CB0205]|uniref:ABC transporter ATP-binding protein n=1 Tax=Synechococcus sp. CB0205 TaxID=232363 RepID=UPI0002001E4A|nr:ABC transporter ATP-binding protein [Synechococcus sp. CB0205]